MTPKRIVSRLLGILLLILISLTSAPQASAANYEVNAVLTNAAGTPVSSMDAGNYYYFKVTVINNTAASKVMFASVHLSKNVFHVVQNAPVTITCTPWFYDPYGRDCEITVPANTQYTITYTIWPGRFDSWGGSADPIVTQLYVTGVGTVETENDVFNNYGSNGILDSEIDPDWASVADSIDSLGKYIFHDNLDYTFSTHVHLPYCDLSCTQSGFILFNFGPAFTPKFVGGVLQAKFYKVVDQPAYGYVQCTQPDPTGQPALIQCATTNWDWGQWSDPELVVTGHTLDRTGHGAVQSGMRFYYNNSAGRTEVMEWHVYEVWP